MITVDHLRRIAGARSSHALMTPIAAAINKWAAHYGVTSQGDLARFLANASVETAGFTRLEESLNYSVDGLLGTFGRHRISEADARKYGRTKNRKANQRAIANIIYGGAWGKKNLGNTQPNDGWDLRGSGIKQTTGRANFQEVEKETGFPVTREPDLLRKDVDLAVRAAFIFWKNRNLSNVTDITAGRKIVNGGTNGLPEVKAALARAMKLQLSVPASAKVQPVVLPVELPAVPVVAPNATAQKPVVKDDLTPQMPVNPAAPMATPVPAKGIAAAFVALIAAIGAGMLATACMLPQWLLDFTGLAAKCIK